MWFQQEELKSTEEHLTVYTGEMVAILVALITLGWKNGNRQSRNMVRLSFSPSKFNIFPFKKLTILYEILHSVTRITNQGGQVIFVGLSTWRGIKGRKEGLKKENVEMQIRFSKAEVETA